MTTLTADLSRLCAIKDLKNEHIESMRTQLADVLTCWEITTDQGMASDLTPVLLWIARGHIGQGEVEIMAESPAALVRRAWRIEDTAEAKQAIVERAT